MTTRPALKVPWAALAVSLFNVYLYPCPTHPATIKLWLLSFPKFMMDEEMLCAMKRLHDGVAISEKKANVELIKKVGPRGVAAIRRGRNTKRLP